MEKEFKIMKEIDRLEKLFEKKKKQRATKTIIAITIFFYLVGTFVFGVDGPLNYLTNIPVAFVFALIYYFISALIFGTLASKSESERNHIRRLQTDLETIRKEKEME